MMRSQTGTLLLVGAAVLVSVPSVSSAQCRSAVAQSSTRIVQIGRGSNEQWPWLAALRLRDPATNHEHYVCGGTVIEDNWVLTAAHCLRNQYFSISKKKSGFWETEDGFRLEIVLGTDNLMDVQQGNVVEVEQALIHEDYVDAQRSGNDIALVQLRKPWKGAVCPRAKLPEGAWSVALRVAGFGAQSMGATSRQFTRRDGSTFSALTPELRQITLVEATRQLCKSAYGNWRAEIGPGQICAGLRWNGDDACQGDSGGPMVAMDASQCPNLVGIVSWGEGCGLGGRFGVYTRISHYEDWIIGKIRGPRAVKVAVPPPIADVQKSLLAQLDEALMPVKGKVRVSLSVGSSVKVGNGFLVNVESSVTGRMIILDIDADGHVWQLYPTRRMMKNTIAGGEAFLIPSAGMGFDFFEATRPTGKDRLITLVVPKSFPYERLVGSEEVMRRGVLPSGSLSSKIRIQDQDRGRYLINLIQQVLKTLEMEGGLETSKWAYNASEYEVLP